jgi:hypothetical protein
MVVVVAILAMVMQAPIWYLMAKASALTGGDGWHRSYLLDVSFQHLNLWWLAGMPIHETWDWFPYGIEATGGADITNQFLVFALDAGLLAMFSFIFLLTQAFKRVGFAMKLVRHGKAPVAGQEQMLWALGVVIALHIVNWLGIAYFDQTYAIWYLQLASLASLSDDAIARLTGKPSTALRGAASPAVRNNPQPFPS